jgi:quercetin 2,3-dioxygenase
MMILRRSEDRGSHDFGWLKAKYSFTFGDYYDPEFLGFRHLLVINQDIIEEGKGFPTHSHKDMEIVSYVISGALEHKDSLGNTEVLRPGQIQRMSAGTGVKHSEYNPSANEQTHMLQIWISPDRLGLNPSYEQIDIETSIGMHLIVSPEGGKGIAKIHQDVSIYKGKLAHGGTCSYSLKSKRHAWVQVVSGILSVQDKQLHAGDGAALSGIENLYFKAMSDCEFLFFDLN